MTSDYENTPDVPCFFEVDSTVQSISQDGQFVLRDEEIICCDGDVLNFVSVITCKLTRSLRLPDGNITCLALAEDHKRMATLHSATIRLFSVADGTVYRMWKHGHKGAVLKSMFSPSSDCLATGGSEGSVRVWNIESTTCTHLIPAGDGPVSVLKFVQKYLLFSNSGNCAIVIYNLTDGKVQSKIGFHISVVTCIDLTNDGKLVSASRDGIILFSRFPSGEQLFTIQAFESIESFLLIDGKLLTFGSLGRMREWDTERRCCTNDDPLNLKSIDTDSDTHSFTRVEKNSKYIVIASVQGIFYVLNEVFDLVAEIVYSLHDIKEMKCLREDTVVFTVGSDKIMTLCSNTGYKTSSVTASGDHILSLDVCANFLVGGTKAGAIYLWKFDDDCNFTDLLARGSGHAGSVLSISICSAGFVISGSSDGSFKLWQYDGHQLKSIATRCAHSNNEISYTSVIPTGEKFATASSKDTSVCVWYTKDVSSAFVLSESGKKFVTMIRFSKYAELLAVSYVDNTLRIVCSNSGKCLQTINGCELPVLSVIFFPCGFRILCGDGAGLLKLWDAKSCECKFTMSNLSSSIVSIDMCNSSIFCAYTHGVIETLKDVSKEKIDAEKIAARQICLNEQTLNNLLAQNRLLEAVKLCIEMEQPFRILNLFTDMMYDPRLKDLIESLQLQELKSILKYLSFWNTFGRFSTVSQTVLHLILRNFHPSDILAVPGISELLEAILPYTQRHSHRYNKLYQAAHLLEFTCHSFRSVSEGVSASKNET